MTSKSTRYRVIFTASAERDLQALIDYIDAHDSAQRAQYVLDKLEALCTSLTDDPERGNVVRELSALGLKQYRQLVWKPYRVVYHCHANTVAIMLVVDGRRDMQTLLAQRLLS